MSRRADIIVTGDNVGERLDKVLSSTGLVSQREGRRLIQQGSVWVDGKRVKGVGRKLGVGQRVIVYLPLRPSSVPRGPSSVPRGEPRGLPGDAASGSPANVPSGLEVLHQDREICAIHKPAGLASAPTPRRDQGVATTILARQLGLSAPPIPIHRLDRDTSGVMVLALNREAAARYTELQMRGVVERRYTAVGRGAVAPRSGRWEWPLARDRRRRDRWQVDAQRGKRAVTLYEMGAPLERFPSLFFYHLQLVTGRTHQIRLHMAKAGAPVVGDPWYGYGRRRPVRHLGGEVVNPPRLLLHSTCFCVPGEVEIRCEPPECFDTLGAIEEPSPH